MAEVILQIAVLPASFAWMAVGGDVTSTSGVLDAMLKGGPFAIVLLLIILDKLGTNSERDKLRTENADQRKQIQDLNEEIRKEVVPVLTEMNTLMSDTVQALGSNYTPPKRQPARRGS